MTINLDEIVLEERESWPFKDMNVGDKELFSVLDDEERAHKARSYCHTYGRPLGKKFKARTHRMIVEGKYKKFVIVERVK